MEKVRHVHLDVRLVPGTRTVRVPLTQEATAADVVHTCKTILNLDADYSLAADFDGFEKQFNEEERLYHLVKKHVFLAGLDQQVQFFIRKRKKCHHSPGFTENPGGKNNGKPVGVMMERDVSNAAVAVEGEGRLISHSNLVYCTNCSFSPTLDTVQMTENKQFSTGTESSINDALLSNMNSMSYTDLLRMVDRQKRQIDANKAAITVKETRLNGLRSDQHRRDGGQNAETEAILTSRLHQLRQQIKEEDAQLQRLRRLRCDVEEERRRSVNVRTSLHEARMLLAEKERQLKDANTRVQNLMRHLDTTRHRRTNGEHESQQQQQQKQQSNYAVVTASGKLEKGNEKIQNTRLDTAYFHHQRPKAAIEPFKVVPPSHSLSTDNTYPKYNQLTFDGAPHGASLDYLHSKGFVAAFTAMEEALQQTNDARGNLVEAVAEGGIKPNVTNAYHSGRTTPSSGTYYKLPLAKQPPSPQTGSVGARRPAVMDGNEKLGDQQQRSWLDGRQVPGDIALPQPVIPKVSISINRRFQIANASPLLYEERPPPDLIPANEKMKFSSFEEATMANASASAIPSHPSATGHTQSVALENASPEIGRVSATNPSQTDPTQPRGDADKIHLRNDTLRAAKRRSWAENHLPVTTDEAEHIRLLLTRAQQRGKSSVNLSWIFDQLTTSASSGGHHFLEEPPSTAVTTASFHTGTNAITARTKDHTIQSIAPFTTAAMPSAPVQVKCSTPVAAEVSSCSGMESKPAMPSVVDVETHEESEMIELKHQPDQSDDIETGRRFSSGDSLESESDDENSAATEIEYVVNTPTELKPAPDKGILRKTNGAEKSGRRVHFNPLALLLDAALEGQLDLVKSCASKLTDVSTSNEEGITALHNAICAGHYEIVRFLVEAGADVNAEDRDGWTPLHCAASCNNLPMVKFLIERGACVFATTTRDHETPADKCEKEEEGFDGCSQFLYSVQDKMGVLNNGRVYAAYEYEAEYEDELSLKADDAILILRRDDEKEKGWWWAKRESNGEEGFVPRNYLALYPRLVAQRATGLIPTKLEPSSNVSPTPSENKSQDQMEKTEKNETTPDEPTAALNAA